MEKIKELLNSVEDKHVKEILHILIDEIMLLKSSQKTEVRFT